MDCSPPGSSVHGILQVRILEWVAIPFSRHLPSGVAWSEKEKKKYYTKSLLLKWRFSSWHLTGQSSSGVENNRKKDMAGKPGLLQSMGSQRAGHDLVTEQHISTRPKGKACLLSKDFVFRRNE